MLAPCTEDDAMHVFWGRGAPEEGMVRLARGVPGWGLRADGGLAFAVAPTCPRSGFDPGELPERSTEQVSSPRVDED